tara:strand:+ start:347 stop:1525 length:1179 start_codon:yes stop_codon:yes gene_type:complete
MMKNKIAVIGVGSAGIQSLCHFISRLNETWEVTSIHNPSKKILGIGESSNPVFLASLEEGLRFDLTNDLDKLNGTLKFGTRYEDWRAHKFTNPLIAGSVAIHFDSNSLYDFAMDRLSSIWDDKFKVIKGNVDSLENNKDSVKLQINGSEHSFDFVIDCSGSPKSFNDYKVVKPLLNSCIVHNTKPIPAEVMECTGHIATKDGWMFRVPLTTRTSYGYLYNNNITNDTEAKKNFSDIIDVPASELQLAKYDFSSYYTQNAFNGRVLKNGNAVAFFEPMFANSLFLYDRVNRVAIDYITGMINEDTANDMIDETAGVILSTIAFHYLKGSTYPTKFWEYAKKWGKEETSKTRIIEYHSYILDCVAKNGALASIEDYTFSSGGFAKLAKNLEYTT